MSEEIRILTTKYTYKEQVEWIEANTRLRHFGDMPNFGFVDHAVYFINVSSLGFQHMCPMLDDISYEILPFADETKAKLKELYPKDEDIFGEPYPSDEELDEMRDKIKALEKDASVTKVINMKDKIKRLEQEVDKLRHESAKFETFYNEEKAVKEQLKENLFAIGSANHWSEQKEAELIAVRAENNNLKDVQDGMDEERTGLKKAVEIARAECISSVERIRTLELRIGSIVAIGKQD
jgi:predicted RNase H-like nuclease (RuvC/YqgF family)